MSKITIIDGNSLLFRAYFATAYPGMEIMRNQEGIPTNAIFTFSTMINKILGEIKEDEGIMVAFDTGKDTFRNDLLDTYKIHRKPTPEQLVQQFPIAREMLNSLNIFTYEQDGFEGDDIAGTVAKMAEKAGYQVVIYTSDRDFLQLASDKISINIIKKGLSDVVTMTPKLVEETYGFAPEQIVDYKGLRGDDSDNLPGIKGIGNVTAVKLIQQYGSFDNIVVHADEINGKIGESLREQKDIGRLSRDLAIIRTDVNLPFSIEDTIYRGYEFTAVSAFAQKYGLKQFIARINPKWKISELAKVEVPIKVVSSLKDIKFNNKIGIALDYADDNYTLGSFYGIAISNGEVSYYLSIEDLKNDTTALEILKDKNIHKYCFDYKAIKVALNKNDIAIKGLKFDLLIASYLLDSSIKNDVQAVMNIHGVDLGNGVETLSLFASEDSEKSGRIAFFILKLARKIQEELEKMELYKLFEELEIPLVNTLADMEIEGFPLDKNVLQQFGDTYQQKLDEISSEIFTLVGEKFNLASPKQIADILFNKLGLSSNKKLSTAVDSLNEIKDEHPVVEKILEYRKYFKLLTTYVEGLKNHIYPDGKIHPKFNQALTTTGRLSSSDPNIQNISVRDEEGKAIRKAFYYPDHQYEILSFDYSQIELRVLAALSNCQALKEIFLSNQDIHAATAVRIFNLQSAPNDVQRRKAKTVNFGVVYGISDWGLAEQLEIPPKEAKAIIDAFYHNFPEVANFFNSIVSEALKNGYVSTLLGRRRYLRELSDTNYQKREAAKRAAMNAPVQGTAADLIKLAMNKIHQALEEGNYQTRMVLQIHDELIFRVPNKEKEQVYALIKNIMENALDLGLPLEVNGGFGLDWYSAK